MAEDEARLERIDDMVTQLLRHVAALQGDTKRQFDELKTEVGSARDELRAEIAGVRDGLLCEIGGVRGELREARNHFDARLIALEKEMAQMREDVQVSWLEAVRQNTDLGKRVQRLEMKLSEEK